MSDTLDVLACGCAGDRIAFDDLIGVLGDKCYAGLLFLLAAPNIVPLPPLADVVLSVPLALLAGQLALGLRRPWFPGFVRRREVSTDLFSRISTRLEPITRKAEGLLRRRLDPLSGIVGRRFVGLVCLALAVVLALPIPLGNMPPGAAISILALGLMVRDGIAILAGFAASIGVVGALGALSLGAVEIGARLFEIGN